MVLILLFVLCNHDYTKSKSEEKWYLHEGRVFIDTFKVGNATGMIDKEILVQFI